MTSNRSRACPSARRPPRARLRGRGTELEGGREVIKSGR